MIHSWYWDMYNAYLLESYESQGAVGYQRSERVQVSFEGGHDQRRTILSACIHIRGDIEYMVDQIHDVAQFTRSLVSSLIYNKQNDILRTDPTQRIAAEAILQHKYYQL